MAAKTTDLELSATAQLTLAMAQEAYEDLNSGNVAACFPPVWEAKNVAIICKGVGFGDRVALAEKLEVRYALGADSALFTPAMQIAKDRLADLIAKLQSGRVTVCFVPQRLQPNAPQVSPFGNGIGDQMLTEKGFRFETQIVNGG